VEYARAARRAGRERYGIKSIYERLRWHMNVETTGSEEFKLNDHYTSRYARLLMENEPDLKGFFETRTLRSK
jgi:hypothetical protein